MKYIIKHNLPEGFFYDRIIDNFQTRECAADFFVQIYKTLVANGYGVKVFLRNEIDKPLRGQIRVEVDGFYYYIELFIKQEEP